MATIGRRRANIDEQAQVISPDPDGGEIGSSISISDGLQATTSAMAASGTTSASVLA